MLVKMTPRIRAYTAPLIFMLMTGITIEPSWVASQATIPSFSRMTTGPFQLAGRGGISFLVLLNSAVVELAVDGVHIADGSPPACTHRRDSP